MMCNIETAPEDAANFLSAAMELICACLSLATKASAETIAAATGIATDVVYELMRDMERIGRVRRVGDDWECV